MNKDVAINIREKMFEVNKIARDNNVEYLYLFIVPTEREPGVETDKLLLSNSSETELLVKTFKNNFAPFVKAILKDEEDKKQIK